MHLTFETDLLDKKFQFINTSNIINQKLTTTPIDRKESGLVRALLAKKTIPQAKS